jgi:hypothetical protein
MSELPGVNKYDLTHWTMERKDKKPKEIRKENLSMDEFEELFKVISDNEQAVLLCIYVTVESLYTHIIGTNQMRQKNNWARFYDQTDESDLGDISDIRLQGFRLLKQAVFAQRKELRAHALQSLKNQCKQYINTKLEQNSVQKDELT